MHGPEFAVLRWNPVNMRFSPDSSIVVARAGKCIGPTELYYITGGSARGKKGSQNCPKKNMAALTPFP